ncbi:S-layer homology domain-containing protein [Paenibacillus sp. y28]|uniref:S-layer homology domain-containing protein n=1 Tax=Paenibacillus sp. y28 TaxID=3129110 RepID=UPI003019BA00
MLKRWMALLMAFCMLLAAAFPAAAAEETPVFADLNNHWAKADLELLAKKGILNGVQDNGQLAALPDKPISRAEYVKLIVNALGWTQSATHTDVFSDVSAGHWAAPYVSAAVAHGLTDGYQDGTFKPDNLVTRAEMAVLLVRAFELKQGEASAVAFTDVDESHWAYAAIQTAASHGIIDGLELNGKRVFQPGDTATRAQAMTVIARQLKQLPDTEAEKPEEKPGIDTPAVEPGAQAGASTGSSSGSKRDKKTINVSLNGESIKDQLNGGNDLIHTDPLNNVVELVGLDITGFRGTASNIQVAFENSSDVFSDAGLSVPGLTGPVVEFTTNGYTFSQATLSFDVSGVAGQDNLAAAYYNETANKFEFLPTTYDAAAQKLSFVTTHNSKYVLIDKTAWEQAWRSAISVTDETYKPFIDFAFVIDSSGSMTWTDPLDLRKRAVTDLVYGLKYDAQSPLVSETVTVALATYSYGPNYTGEYTTVTNSVYSASDRASIIDFDDVAVTGATFSAHSQTVAEAVYNINSSGGTNIFGGLRQAVHEFKQNGNPDNRWVIVLLSDGQNTYGNDFEAVREAYAQGIVIFTMGLSEEADESLLRNIAIQGGGQYFFIQTAEQLEANFQTIVGTSQDKTKDEDNDGLPDYYEATGMLLENGMIIRTSIDPVTGADTDGDGFTDGEEMGQPVEIVITADMVPDGSTLVGETVLVFKNYKSSPTNASSTPLNP